MKFHRVKFELLDRCVEVDFLQSIVDLVQPGLGLCHVRLESSLEANFIILLKSYLYIYIYALCWGNIWKRNKLFRIVYLRRLAFCPVCRDLWNGHIHNSILTVGPDPGTNDPWTTERTYFREKTDNSGSLKGLRLKAASLITHVQQAEPSIIWYLSFTRRFEKPPQTLDITHSLCISLYGRLGPTNWMNDNDGALALCLSLRCRSKAKKHCLESAAGKVCIHNKNIPIILQLFGRLNWLLKQRQTTLWYKG